MMGLETDFAVERECHYRLDAVSGSGRGGGGLSEGAWSAG